MQWIDLAKRRVALNHCSAKFLFFSKNSFTSTVDFFFFPGDEWQAVAAKGQKYPLPFLYGSNQLTTTIAGARIGLQEKRKERSVEEEGQEPIPVCMTQNNPEGRNECGWLPSG
jgi:hypothetical protein